MFKLGDKLKEIRVLSGFKTQKDLSRAMGEKNWSRGRIANYESNQHPPPDDFLEAFEVATQVDIRAEIAKSQRTLIHELIDNIENVGNLDSDQLTLISLLKTEFQRVLEEKETLEQRYNKIKKTLDLRDVQISEILKLNDILKRKVR